MWGVCLYFTIGYIYWPISLRAINSLVDWNTAKIASLHPFVCLHAKPDHATNEDHCTPK